MLFNACILSNYSVVANGQICTKHKTEFSSDQLKGKWNDWNLDCTTRSLFLKIKPNFNFLIFSYFLMIWTKKNVIFDDNCTELKCFSQSFYDENGSVRFCHIFGVNLLLCYNFDRVPTTTRTGQAGLTYFINVCDFS